MMKIKRYRWFDRDTWCLWKEGAFIVYIDFYPLNHLWFHCYGWVHCNIHKWTDGWEDAYYEGEEFS